MLVTLLSRPPACWALHIHDSSHWFSLCFHPLNLVPFPRTSCSSSNPSSSSHPGKWRSFVTSSHCRHEVQLPSGLRVISAVYVAIYCSAAQSILFLNLAINALDFWLSCRLAWCWLRLNWMIDDVIHSCHWTSFKASSACPTCIWRSVSGRPGMHDESWRLEVIDNGR